MIKIMTDKTRYFNYLINFMQRRLKAKCATINAKVAVVKSQWEKLSTVLFFKATIYKDEGMK
jgi:hypothetical protein